MREKERNGAEDERGKKMACILHSLSPTVCLVLSVHFFYHGTEACAPVSRLTTGVRGEPSTGGCMAESDFARYRANLQDEIDSAALYRTLADVEAQPQLAEVYRRLALVEERHA